MRLQGGMRRTGLLSPAAPSAVWAIAAAGLLCAATRPHYGGSLRVETRDPAGTADPPQFGRLADPAGSFRITRWEPGRRAAYTAEENAAGGRPFLDSIEIELARPLREQALD